MGKNAVALFFDIIVFVFGLYYSRQPDMRYELQRRREKK